ncbi:MAG: MBL fold metallo-hydrolase [Oscillospiraceae bacterium]|jgi:phosphoribosyl 1,2-cyclic phosphodiesterase
MIRLLPLASSSKGNSTYVGTESAGILIDAGIGPRIFQGALGLGGIEDIRNIRAIFITHEHSDHIKGLLKLTERLDVPVYGSRETLVELIEKDAVCPHTKLYEINRKTVEAAGMEIRAFTTSHDSVHSLGYRITTPDGKQLAVCTDLGVVTPEVHSALTGCQLVMLESNYDREMLRNGGYPAYLKRRIASERGHLCNTDCAAELVALAQSGTEHFVLGHLSEENNRPEVAAETSLAALTGAGFHLERDFTLLTAPRSTTGQFVTL